jgi:microcystin-dependent protein
VPFNGSGSFSLAEPAFVPNTTISSAAMNSDLSDIADGLSECLTTDGQSTMSAQIKGFAGTVTVPGYGFSTDPNTGIYRIAADNIGVAAGGTKILDVSTSGLNVIGAVSQNGIAILPVGLGPLPWSGTTAPSGWLLCYGQSLSRATYAALFAVIGTTFGSVDGSSFSLPDLRGRIAAGKDDMGGTAANRLTTGGSGVDGLTLGAVGGAQNITLDLTMIPAHDHGGSVGSTTSQLRIGPGGSPTTGLNATVNTSLDGQPGGVQLSGQAAGNSITSVAHDHTITSAGGGLAHNNVQPTIITNYIIYAGV